MDVVSNNMGKNGFAYNTASHTLFLLVKGLQMQLHSYDIKSLDSTNLSFFGSQIHIRGKTVMVNFITQCAICKPKSIVYIYVTLPLTLHISRSSQKI